MSTIEATNALKLALEALEKTALIFGDDSLSSKAAAALREALAQERSSDEQPAQEPVAWTATRLWNRRELWNCPADIERDLVDGYTSLPAQRTWVHATTWRGLTDDEKLHIEIMGGKSDVMLAEMVEAKLKEKNSD